MNVNEDAIDNLKGIRTGAPLPPAYVAARAVECIFLSERARRHQIADVHVRASLPVSVARLPTPLMGECIRRGNVLRQTQDVGGRQHKFPLPDDLTDRKML